MFGLFAKRRRSGDPSGEQPADSQQPPAADAPDQIPVDYMAELLSVAYVSLADGHLVEAEMEALYDMATQLTRQPEHGLAALMSLQTLIADGGDTACAYQYRQWGADRFPLEQKRGIIEAGFMIAIVDGDLTEVEFGALEKISRWIALPPGEFAACLRAIADDLQRAGPR